MAKLYYRYSAMNAGKSTLAMQVAHNYEEKGGKIVVFKPLIDTKGNKTIVSRIGISRTVDHLLSKEESPIKIIKDIADLDAIIVDEAQFLEPFQIDELYYIAKKMNISVLCFGLRCDFQMQVFPGSARLLAIADSIEEIKTLCECKKRKATQNLRLVNGLPTFEGNQVAIDGEENVTYISLCGEFYIKYYEEWLKKHPQKMLARRKKD